MTREELEKMYQGFVGKGKVQSVSLKKEGDTGEWRWEYKEKNRPQHIIDKDREFLEKMHMEFGGKNPETCRAPDLFLELNSWNSDNLLELGHSITKIQLKGRQVVKDDPIIQELPPNTGTDQPIRAKRNKHKDIITVRNKETKEVMITRAFSSREEFDAFRHHLINDPYLGKLKWYVNVLGSESKETGDQCVWIRQQVGDGTSRMALELMKLNSIKFTECRRNDLINAAGDMFDSPCNRITVEKKEPFHRDVCMYAAESGALDLDGYGPTTH